MLSISSRLNDWATCIGIDIDSVLQCSSIPILNETSSIPLKCHCILCNEEIDYNCIKKNNQIIPCKRFILCYIDTLKGKDHLSNKSVTNKYFPIYAYDDINQLLSILETLSDDEFFIHISSIIVFVHLLLSWLRHHPTNPIIQLRIIPFFLNIFIPFITTHEVFIKSFLSFNFMSHQVEHEQVDDTIVILNEYATFIPKLTLFEWEFQFMNINDICLEILKGCSYESNLAELNWENWNIRLTGVFLYVWYQIHSDYLVKDICYPKRDVLIPMSEILCTCINGIKVNHNCNISYNFNELTTRFLFRTNSIGLLPWFLYFIFPNHTLSHSPLSMTHMFPLFPNIKILPIIIMCIYKRVQNRQIKNRIIQLLLKAISYDLYLKQSCYSQTDMGFIEKMKLPNLQLCYHPHTIDLLQMILFCHIPKQNDLTSHSSLDTWEIIWSLCCHSNQLFPDKIYDILQGMIIGDAFFSFLYSMITEASDSTDDEFQWFSRSRNLSLPLAFFYNLGWSIETTITYLHDIWNSITLPVLSELPNAAYMIIAAIRLRFITLAQVFIDTPVINKFIQTHTSGFRLSSILETMSCTNPLIFSSISSGLSSSRPALRLAAQVVLVYTMNCLKHQPNGLHHSIDSEECDLIPQSDTPTIQWLSAVLSPPHVVLVDKEHHLKIWGLFQEPITNTLSKVTEIKDAVKTRRNHCQDNTQSETLSCTPTSISNPLITEISSSSTSQQLLSSVPLIELSDDTVIDDEDSLYFNTMGPVHSISDLSSPYEQSSQTENVQQNLQIDITKVNQLQVTNRHMLEIPQCNNNLLIKQSSSAMPPSNLLTATIPTSLRQCFERLTEKLRPTDRPYGGIETIISRNTSHKSLKEESKPSVSYPDETPVETYWRIRRVLLTIPLIISHDYEAEQIAGSLFSIVVSLENIYDMDDFSKLQLEASTSILVHWPRQSISCASEKVFDSNLAFIQRLRSLEIIRIAAKTLSNGTPMTLKQKKNDDNINKKKCSTKNINCFVSYAPIFLGQLLKAFEQQSKSTDYKPTILDVIQSNQSKTMEDQMIDEQPFLLVGDLLQTFALIIELSEASTEINQMLKQLTDFIFITLESQHNHLRRSSYSLLTKYPLILSSWASLQDVFADKLYWLVHTLKNTIMNDNDEICRNMSTLILQAIQSTADIRGT